MRPRHHHEGRPGGPAGLAGGGRGHRGVQEPPEQRRARAGGGAGGGSAPGRLRQAVPDERGRLRAPRGGVRGARVLVDHCLLWPHGRLACHRHLHPLLPHQERPRHEDAGAAVDVDESRVHVRFRSDSHQAQPVDVHDELHVLDGRQHRCLVCVLGRRAVLDPGHLGGLPFQHHQGTHACPSGQVLRQDARRAHHEPHGERHDECRHAGIHWLLFNDWHGLVTCRARLLRASHHAPVVHAHHGPLLLPGVLADRPVLEDDGPPPLPDAGEQVRGQHRDRRGGEHAGDGPRVRHAAVPAPDLRPGGAQDDQRGLPGRHRLHPLALQPALCAWGVLHHRAGLGLRLDSGHHGRWRGEPRHQHDVLDHRVDRVQHPHRLDGAVPDHRHEPHLRVHLAPGGEGGVPVLGRHVQEHDREGCAEGDGHAGVPGGRRPLQHHPALAQAGREARGAARRQALLRGGQGQDAERPRPAQPGVARGAPLAPHRGRQRHR
mmetsp:Transcript_104595/g.327272  ORF Transcript_104595/g.327272 Transcript_104595/m.327272 type:complete len:489 (+) Transcript_104595:455-1921(+)